MFVAHVGLDDLLSLGDLWHRVPIRRTVQATYWVAERDGSTGGPVKTSNWLWDQWGSVDTWIDTHSDILDV